MALKVRRILKFIGTALVLSGFLGSSAAAVTNLSGRLMDPQGNAVAGATVRLLAPSESVKYETWTDSAGQFIFVGVGAGEYNLAADYPGFTPFRKSLALGEGNQTENIRFSGLASQTESVRVTADVNDFSVLIPDPSEKVFVRQDLLDANPGRPGAPVSIPGYPIETASSGIKAPQYFAPGVAGDHGEPIAQFIAVGSYLVPNNLSANAHGNGYSDPNILIPQVLESVQVEGGPSMFAREIIRLTSPQRMASDLNCNRFSRSRAISET
jgi:hypothetical protein